MKTKLSDYGTKRIDVVDELTGFKGVVTGHADYVTGCDQYLVQPPSKDGEWKEPKWFDEKRLGILEASQQVVIDEDKNGADIPAPIK